MAVGQAERVLAQGEPSQDALKQFQQLLEKEEPEPLLLIAARGERAGLDRLIETIQSGKTKLTARDLAVTARFGGQSAPSAVEDLVLWMPGSYKGQRAAMLRYMNRYVEIAKQPPEQQHARFRQLEATTKDQPVLVRLLVPALSKVAEAARRSQAQLRHCGGRGRALSPGQRPVARHFGRTERGRLRPGGADRPLRRSAPALAPPGRRFGGVLGRPRRRG
jgi:hypothetical protein